MTDPSELQQSYLDAIDTALTLGTLGGSLVIFLLAIIAVRGLASWK